MVGKRQIIAQLIKIADELDEQSLPKFANAVTNIAERVAAYDDFSEFEGVNYGDFPGNPEDSNFAPPQKSKKSKIDELLESVKNGYITDEQQQELDELIDLQFLSKPGKGKNPDDVDDMDIEGLFDESGDEDSMDLMDKGQRVSLDDLKDYESGSDFGGIFSGKMVKKTRTAGK
jgi:hypothetical protein